MALDQSHLIDYDLMEKWSHVMLEAYTNPPMEGYSKVTLEQLQKADLEFFKFIMRECRAGIKTYGGAQPMAAAFKEAMKATEIRLCLQPMPSSSLKRKPNDGDDLPPKKAREDPELQKLKDQMKQLQKMVSTQPRSSSMPAKSRGKGKTKAKSKNFIRLPPQLIGLCPTTPEGEPNCYDFSLGGCKLAGQGERCPNGWHRCMHWGCGRTPTEGALGANMVTIVQVPTLRGASRPQVLQRSLWLRWSYVQVVPDCLRLCVVKLGSRRLLLTIPRYSKNVHKALHATINIDLADDSCKVALIFQLGVSVQFRSGHGRARIQLAHPVPCKNSAYQQEGIPWDSNLNRNVLVIVLLVGGLEHFLFSHILGIIIPID